MELSSHISIEEEKMNSAADKAIEYFSILPDTPGIWDTFIPKYVEVGISLFWLKSHSDIKNTYNLGVQRVL